MKQKKILTQEITLSHPNEKSYPTDRYYLNLANKLHDCFYSMKIGDSLLTDDVIRQAAIILTNYMEDIIADSGLWHTFSDMCQKLYGYPVPLFHYEEEYYADEPSLNAIRFLLWSMISNVSDNVINADASSIEKMACAAYDILESAFDEAPINEQLVTDIEAMLQSAAEGFNQMRKVLTWLYMNCYLTTNGHNKELYSSQIEDFVNLVTNPEHQFNTSPSMAMFYANTRCIFFYKTGPLALYPKDYLAAMMRTKGMTSEAADIDRIEVMDFGTYKYEPIKTSFGLFENEPEDEWLKLTNTTGKKIDILAKETNLSKEILNRHEGFIATSFVYYQSEWHLNGIIFPLEDVAKKWKELCEHDTNNLKPGTRTLSAEMMLKRTGGQQIAYFADLEEMKDFLESKLRFPRHMLGFVDEQGGELPTVFIDTKETKGCLQFFFGYSPCIADPGNPFYDKETARKEVIDLLWDAKSVTTNAVKYLLKHNFLPDLYNDHIFSKSCTPEEKDKDIDFLLRFYRRENY